MNLYFRSLLIAFTLLFLLLRNQPLAAQPTISYIIPDIGTPGMNTYVEVIGPQNKSGNFGGTNDVIGNGQVSVQTVNPADTNRVMISPPIVSWQGRMIGCQIFVRDDAALGPVPIRVVVNGVQSNADTFFIVAPQTIGNQNGGGQLGSGTLGRRSKRGAMIVDSLILTNGIYTISTGDTDPQTGGGQGYLPCVILSKGPVLVGFNGEIVVDAIGKHGGPGGGGSGGYGATRPAQPPLIPAVPGELDVPLGNGFSGGVSSVPVVPSPGGFGIGTGPNSASLNGVRANTSFSTTRLYSGGPGHPFDSDGRSGGSAAVSTNPFAPFGIYFGGGGNAGPGTGITAPSFLSVNGQVIGNAAIVPLHGGAGGSSGGSNDSVGGGGGGGIAIYSQSGLSIASITANGGNGRDGFDCGSVLQGCGDPSAGGAGGCIILGARGIVSSGTAHTRGGRGGKAAAVALPGSTAGDGGPGRFRYDGINAGAAFTTTTGGSSSRGISFNPISTTPTPSFFLSGSANTGDTVLIYYRTNRRPWNSTAPLKVVTTGVLWAQQITLQPGDSTVYLFGLRRSLASELATSTPYQQVPAGILSQVAAAIVKFQPAPLIQATLRTGGDSLICDSVLYDTITIHNRGAAPLRIDPQTRITATNGVIAQLILSLAVILQPLDSVRAVVRVQGNGATGRVGYTLSIISNDPDPSRSPMKMLIEHFIFPMKYQMSPLLDFGDVRIGLPKDSLLNMRNTGGVDIQATNFTPLATPFSALWDPASPVTIMPPAGYAFRFRFAPRDTGLFVATLRLRLQPCGVDTAITLRGYGRSGIITTATDWAFDQATCADTATQRYLVKNTGNDTLTLQQPIVTGAGFALVQPAAGMWPIALAPKDSIFIYLHANLNGAASISGSVVFQTDDLLPGKNPHSVSLTAARDNVKLLGDSIINFGKVCVGSSAARNARLVNGGTRTVATLESGVFAGTTAAFVISNSAFPRTLSASAQDSVLVQFSPTRTGPFVDTLAIFYRPCNQFRNIVVIGEGIANSGEYSVQGVDFGDVPLTQPAQRTVVIRNTATTPGQDLVIDRLSSDPRVRILSPTIPPALRIAPNDSVVVTIEFAPTAPDTLKNAYLTATIASPCASTILLPIFGQGVGEGLLLSKSVIGYPPTLRCQNSTDTLVIWNRTGAAVQLGTISLVPSSATAFLTVQQLVGNNTVLPQDSALFAITFTPTDPPDGPRSATLQFTTTDPQRPLLQVPIVGERATQQLTFPLINFFNTPVSTSASVRQLLQNSGTASVEIRSLTAPPPFRVVATRPGLPITLKVGESVEVELEFSAAEAGTFNDSIRVVGTFPCGETPAFPISGRGVAQLDLSGYWEDISAAPGQEVLLPLRVDRDLTPAAITGYSITLGFNRTLLRPTGIILDGTLSQGWTTIISKMEPGVVEFTAGGATPLRGSGIVAYVAARATLGDSASTLIASPSSAQLTGLSTALSIAPGLFRLRDVCEEGGVRLVRSTGGFGIKLVAPQPATGETEVTIGTVEDGSVLVRLLDARGSVVETLVKESLPHGEHRLRLSAGWITAGVYFLELRTPTQTDRRAIIIAR